MILLCLSEHQKLLWGTFHFNPSDRIKVELTELLDQLIMNPLRTVRQKHINGQR